MTLKNNTAEYKVAALLTAVLLLTLTASLTFGSAEMSLQGLIGGILRKDGFATESTILYSLRLPRVLGAAIAGVGLSCSGVLLQAVTGNALASPNIIGVNAGAGFAVILVMAFIPAAVYFLPLAAFSGALCTTLFILFLASKISFSKSTVILSGVAVTALLNAGISLISYFDGDLVALYRDFSVGGLSGTVYGKIKLPAIIISVSVIICFIISSRIDTLCLGDSLALSLGVNVKLLRLVCIILASLTAGATVCFAGLLGFVGLVVPHIAKRLTDKGTGFVLLYSCLTGAILVTASDLLGRVILAPTEVPVGIIMSFIGAPFLFYLLIRRKSHG